MTFQVKADEIIKGMNAGGVGEGGEEEKKRGEALWALGTEKSGQ